jgi:hypothetical protein
MRIVVTAYASSLVSLAVIGLFISCIAVLAALASGA